MEAKLYDWQSWLDRHGPALLLFARQLTASPSDAEDIVQEAFIRFWSARRRSNDPVAYLFVCVRNCAMEWHRSSERRSRREQTAARGEACFASDLDKDERRRLIEAALRQLPAEQREVVVMKIWGELSFAQIAGVLQVSPNTASSRYRYALDKLRQHLAQETVA